MAKIIRPTYPMEYSIGILLLVFVISLFLSGQVFSIPHPELNDDKNVYLGMFLVSIAVVIMFLVLWEEFLFPIRIKPSAEEMIFRNHRTKLKKQLLIYCIIPAIFVFVYYRYEVNHLRLGIWAAICVISPVAGKLISGIKNYNDFLRLSDDDIEYKNNEKEGVYLLKDILQVVLIKDDRKVLHKIQLLLVNKDEIIIDLDEMELEAFILSIEKYITVHYKPLLKGSVA